MSFETLETDRLILRQWKQRDFVVLAPHFQDVEFTKYLGGIKDNEAAWAMMANYAGQWELLGFSYWALEKKLTSQFIGGCGLWKSPDWPEIELGYWILPSFQGKGYATEAANHAKNYALNVLQLPTLVSYIDPMNDASVKVAERLGGVYDHNIELSTFGTHSVYRYQKIQ